MDDNPSRRGQPSNHIVYGIDMAILAGDALFPLEFRHIVSRTPTDLVPETRLQRVMAEVARSVGSTGMAAGQLLDLKGGSNSIKFVQHKKFGEMAEWSAVCGGLLGGADDDEMRRLRRYGRAVGVMYQVVDDILEEKTAYSSEGTKEERSSKKKGKSYVRFYGMEKATEIAEELWGKAKKNSTGLRSTARGSSPSTVLWIKPRAGASPLEIRVNRFLQIPVNIPNVGNDFCGFANTVITMITDVARASGCDWRL